MPHSSRTAQKLEPEQKLIAAVQLDAAFSLLQLSVQQGEREQYNALSLSMPISKSGTKPSNTSIRK
jgi:hypothetical protein